MTDKLLPAIPRKTLKETLESKQNLVVGGTSRWIISEALKEIETLRSQLSSDRPITTQRVIAMLDAQNAKGLAKYGTTIDEAQDSSYDWRLMAMEEMIDCLQYQQREIMRLEQELVVLREKDERECLITVEIKRENENLRKANTAMREELELLRESAWMHGGTKAVERLDILLSRYPKEV